MIDFDAAPDVLNARDQREEQEAKQRDLTHKERVADAAALLKLPAGRRFLRWLESLQPVGASTYTGNANSYRLEGRREITRAVRRLLEEADPTLVPWLDRSEETK